MKKRKKERKKLFTTEKNDMKKKMTGMKIENR